MNRASQSIVVFCSPTHVCNPLDLFLDCLVIYPFTGAIVTDKIIQNGLLIVRKRVLFAKNDTLISALLSKLSKSIVSNSIAKVEFTQVKN